MPESETPHVVSHENVVFLIDLELVSVMLCLRLGTTFMKRGVVFTLASLAFAGWAQAQAVNPALPTIPTNNFNVTKYGAIGDGKTDNTAAIVNAINAAAAKGGTVEFPAVRSLCTAA
jgi:polygalacturonase